MTITKFINTNLEITVLFETLLNEHFVMYSKYENHYYYNIRDYLLVISCLQLATDISISHLYW
jgi:hypothetical protein